MRTEFYMFCFCHFYVPTAFLREGGEECQAVAGGYLYHCFVMNEALECSPNYTHNTFVDYTLPRARFRFTLGIEGD